MSIVREYYDKDGNYWLSEKPTYIPPEDVIKKTSYVRAVIPAGKRRKNKWYAPTIYILIETVLMMLLIELALTYALLLCTLMRLMNND